MQLRIKQVRESLNLTQEQVADRMSLSQGGYQKVETQERKITVQRLWQVAEVLGCSPLDLVEGVTADGELFSKDAVTAAIIEVLAQTHGSSFQLSPDQTARAVVEIAREIKEDPTSDATSRSRIVKRVVSAIKSEHSKSDANFDNTLAGKLDGYADQKP